MARVVCFLWVLVAYELFIVCIAVVNLPVEVFFGPALVTSH